MSDYEPANSNFSDTKPERRRERRRRVLLTGKIVSAHNSFSADCTIRDISPGGARIVVGQEVIPADPFLIVVKDALAHQSSLAWRTPEHAGLQFQQTFELGRATPLNLRHVQCIWIELMAR